MCSGEAPQVPTTHTKSRTWVQAHPTEVMFLRCRIYFASYRSHDGVLTRINNVYGFSKTISSAFY